MEELKKSGLVEIMSSESIQVKGGVLVNPWAIYQAIKVAVEICMFIEHYRKEFTRGYDDGFGNTVPPIM